MDTTMTSALEQLKARFGKYGISIDGQKPDLLIFGGEETCRRLLEDSPAAFDQAYITGDIEEGAVTLDVIIERLTRKRIPREWLVSPTMRAISKRNRETDQQDLEKSRRIGPLHYDETSLIRSSLASDPYELYSCAAWYAGAKSLAEASRYKLGLLARKLRLTSCSRVLDVGCGYGGLLEYLIGKIELKGIEGVGITRSHAQAIAARVGLSGLPVRIIEGDYRDLEGRFNRLVSVGMFEHVGKQHYNEFFATCDKLLEPPGIVLLHTIIGGGVLPIFEDIFPGCELPTEEDIREAARNHFLVIDWHDLGGNYDPTLGAWHSNFMCAQHRLAETFSKKQLRRWSLYLRTGQGLDRTGHMRVAQIVLAREPIPDYVPVR